MLWYFCKPNKQNTKVPFKSKYLLVAKTPSPVPHHALRLEWESAVILKLWWAGCLDGQDLEAPILEN